MTYKIKLSQKAQKQLKKMDKASSALILKYLFKNVEGTENPRNKGKALVGNRVGQWRYRIGNYRAIVNIKDEELLILALEVGRRRDIY